MVVYVAKKLEHLQTEIHKIVTNLGGQIRYQYIPADVTHLVFVGKPNDLTKEFRTARDDKKQIVSPEWIKMCDDEKRHVEEVRANFYTFIYFGVRSYTLAYFCIL